MRRGFLKEILDDIAQGKDLVSIFLAPGRSPGEVWRALKLLVSMEDSSFFKRTAARYRVDPSYLLHRVQGLIHQIETLEEEDPYSMLEVGYTATPREIHENWKRLMQRWHPDRRGGDPQAQEMCWRLNEAYELLKDRERRREYDKKFVPLLAVLKELREAPGDHRERSSYTMGWLPIAILGMALVLVIFLRALQGGGGRPTSRVSAEYSAPMRAQHINVPRPSLRVSKESHIHILEGPRVREIHHRDFSNGARKEPGGSKGGNQIKANREVHERSGPVISQRVHQIAGKAFTPPERPKKPEAKPCSARKRLAKAGGSLMGEKGVEKKPSPKATPATRVHIVQSRKKRPPLDYGNEKKIEKPKKIVANVVISTKPESLNPGPLSPPSSVPSGLSHPSPSHTFSVDEPISVVERFMEAYRNRDLVQLLSLFSQGAKENGESVRGYIPRYRQFFNAFRVLDYRLFDRKVSPDKGRVKVEGSYLVSLVPRSGSGSVHWIRGRVAWTLVKDEEGQWLIDSLNYTMK